MPELTAQPAIEDMENTKKLEGAGAKQPCGRVVGIIRRHWREKQYCGSLRVEGDRTVTSGKGQTTSALFMPVDRKVGCAVCVCPQYLQCHCPTDDSLVLSNSFASKVALILVACLFKSCSPSLLCLQIPWVRIQTRQRDVLSTKRILVAIDSWPAWCKYPLGHYVKTLGEKGAKATETEVSDTAHLQLQYTMPRHTCCSVAAWYLAFLCGQSPSVPS